MTPASEVFTEAHEQAIMTACEKLWNGEPPDDPMHSPRRPDHPLCVVGNAALDALNAALALRVAYHALAQDRDRLRLAVLMQPDLFGDVA